MDTGNKLVAIINTLTDDERLFPFEKSISSLLPISNQPNLLRIVNIVKKIGIEDIYILNFNNRKEINNTLYPINVKFLDSLDDIKMLNSDLVYIDANIYFNFNDFINMKNKFIKANKSVCLCTNKSQDNRSIYNFGIEVNQDNVINIFGHARDHYVDYILRNIFFLKKDILKYIDLFTKGYSKIVSGGMPKDKYYIENLLQIFIEKNNSITYYLGESKIIVIETVSKLLEANTIDCINNTKNISIDKLCEINSSTNDEYKVVLGENSKIDDTVKLSGNIIVGDNTIIENGVIIEGNAIIGNNTIIKDYAKVLKNSIIGNNCKIGYNAEIGGVIFDGVSAIHNCEIYGVIGKYVDIAAGCISALLRFDDRNQLITTNEFVEDSKYNNSTFIGNYTRTGVNNVFYPGTRIGSCTCLGPGVVVKKDIDHDKIVLLEQNLYIDNWNKNKYKW